MTEIFAREELEKNSAEVEAQKLFELAKIYFEELLELNIPINFRAPDGLKISLAIASSEGQSSAVYLDKQLVFTAAAAGNLASTSRESEVQKADRLAQEEIIDRRLSENEANIVRFIKALPELTTYLRDIQLEREGTALEALDKNSYGGKTSYGKKIKEAMIRLKISVTNPSTPSPEEIKIRKEEADYYLAMVEHLAGDAIKELADSKRNLDLAGDFEGERKREIAEQRRQVADTIKFNNPYLYSPADWEAEKAPEHDFFITASNGIIKIRWYRGLIPLPDQNVQQQIYGYLQTKKTWANKWSEVDLLAGDNGLFVISEDQIVRNKKPDRPKKTQTEEDLALTIFSSQVPIIANMLELDQKKRKLKIEEAFRAFQSV